MTERGERKPGVERETVPGRLIVLYGVNNLGKSTQVSLLTTALAAEGQAVERRKSPNYELPSGQVINSILRDGREHHGQELQLWNALNFHQDEPTITGTLESGADLVSEDYWGTTIAWGLGHGVPREDLDAMIAGLRTPDVAILLHGRRFTDAKEAGHMHEEDDELTERVQRLHLELADEFGWHKVNANQPQEVVHAQIMEVINAAVAA